MKSIRKSLYRLLEPADDHDAASRAVDIFLLTNIVVSIASYIVGTIDALTSQYGVVFAVVDHTTVVIFSLEYVLRLWTIPENPRFASPIWGRLRYMGTGMAVVDLIAILPYFLEFVDMRVARLLRVLRLMRVFKASRYMKSMLLIQSVIVERRHELATSIVFMLFLLILSSSVMYEVENAIQPEKFSSVPATMWWSVASLTTMGYGDIYPISTVGKFLAGVVAVLGIGIFAIPTGIIAAGLSKSYGYLEIPVKYSVAVLLGAQMYGRRELKATH
jgi:voltage-gated potassium channel